MSPARRGRGAGRGRQGREAYHRQIAARPASPTAPTEAGSFDVESPDGTAAPAARAGRIPLQPVAGGRLRRRPRWARWSWPTIWSAVGAVATVVVVIGGVAWWAASHSAGLKSLEEKQTTFAERVNEDLKRLETYIDRRISDLLRRDGRREDEPPPRREGKPPARER